MTNTTKFLQETSSNLARNIFCVQYKCHNNSINGKERHRRRNWKFRREYILTFNRFFLIVLFFPWRSKRILWRQTVQEDYTYVMIFICFSCDVKKFYYLNITTFMIKQYFIPIYLVPEFYFKFCFTMIKTTSSRNIMQVFFSF